MAMPADVGLVELTTAKTTFEAEWIVGAMKGMGISAVTFGGVLADEYTVSQTLMGLSGGVQVMVPRDQLERARQALSEIERNRPAPEETEEEMAAAGDDAEFVDAAGARAPASHGGRKTAIIAVLTVAVIGIGWQACSQGEKLAAYERTNPVTEVTWQGDRWEARWRHNDRLAYVHLDRDRNGIAEEALSHDREGRLFARSLDANQNEFWELFIGTDSEGKERFRSYDENENGIAERLEYVAVDGVQERWLDANEDARYERYEFVDVQSGQVLTAFEDRGRLGFVLVK
jgi:hypothetical protein